MPVPVLVMAPVPAMMPGTVRVGRSPVRVAVPVRVMPRLAARVTSPVVARVAVPIASCPATGEAGAVPRAESAAIERVPVVIVVMPV